MKLFCDPKVLIGFIAKHCYKALLAVSKAVPNMHFAFEKKKKKSWCVQGVIKEQRNKISKLSAPIDAKSIKIRLVGIKHYDKCITIYKNLRVYLE